MIRSMTAYAQHEIKNNWGTTCWELRSVNHRYLETSLRLPEPFRSLEPVVRNRIRAHLTRGKIECSLHFELNPATQTKLLLNKELAQQLIQACDWIKTQSNGGNTNPFDILSWPGVVAAKKQNLDLISASLIEALDMTLADLINAREREGATLQQLIKLRLQAVLEQVQYVRQQMPDILEWQREKWLAKLAEADVQLENNRLEQELILLTQRIDVAEELDRLDAHVKETYNIIKKPEAMGRRLDFIMQEFNRESNTLASKSININVTNSAIELKVLIEQMREQIQNIE